MVNVRIRKTGEPPVLRGTTTAFKCKVRYRIEPAIRHRSDRKGAAAPGRMWLKNLFAADNTTAVELCDDAFYASTMDFHYYLSGRGNGEHDLVVRRSANR